MPFSEKTLQVLMEFGLTSVQARVYLAAVQLKVASASQIAKLTKVRREDVYRSLPKLERLGLVERILRPQITIRATPVDQTLWMLIKQEEEKAKERLKTLRARKGEMLQELKTATAETPTSLEENQQLFSLLSSNDLILCKTAELIEKAEQEIDVIYGRSKLLQILFAFSAPSST